MKRVFIQEYTNGINQIKILDYDNETFTTYMQDTGIGFPFQEPFTQKVTDMGYKDIKDCCKKLKQRGLLQQEVNQEEQFKSEKIGLINLGADRIKRLGRINTKDFEDVIEKLKSYGLGYTDSQNMIIASYLNQCN